MAATHDLNRMVAVADEVLALRDGETLFQGPAEGAFDTELLESIFDTRFDLVTTGAAPLPLVVPARNGR